MLKPENVFEIAGEIVKTQSPFLRTLNTGKKTLEIIQRGVDNKELELDDREQHWIDILRDQLDEIPEDEQEFITTNFEERLNLSKRFMERQLRETTAVWVNRLPEKGDP